MHKTNNNDTRAGFTIVELLIVIVVIGILAAITIVSFNGVQARAKFATNQSDLDNTQKLIELHYAQYGTYPLVAVDWGRQTTSNQNTYIPGLVPEFASMLPIVTDGSGQYLYRTNPTGSEYKLMKYKSGGLTGSEWALVPSTMKESAAVETYKDRWGVWSSGGKTL